MKKLLTIAALLLLGAQAHAQLIFNAGYLHATENLSLTNAVDQTTTGTNALDGFYAGAKYRIGLDGLTEGLSFAPGANVSFLFGKMGNAYDQAYFGGIETLNGANTTEVALNIPLHVQYLFEINPDFKLEAWAGPMFQLGIYDRSIDGDGNPTLIYNHYKDIPYGLTSTIPSRSRINLYLGLGVGVEISSLIHVNVGYDFGLLNLATAPKDKITRGQLRIGVAYNFL